MIYVVATLTIKPETRADFIAAATPASRKPARSRATSPMTCTKASPILQDGVRRAVGECRGAGAASCAEHMKTFGRVAVKCMCGAAEDRVITPRRSTPLSKKRQGRNIHDLCHRHHDNKTGKAGRLHQGRARNVSTRRCNEKGCIAYENHISINDPNLFVVVERWESREDLNAHGKAPHMKVWREYSSQMKTSPTVIEIISDGKVEKF